MTLLTERYSGPCLMTKDAFSKWMYRDFTIKPRRLNDWLKDLRDQLVKKM